MSYEHLGICKTGSTSSRSGVFREHGVNAMSDKKVLRRASDGLSKMLKAISARVNRYLVISLLCIVGLYILQAIVSLVSINGTALVRYVPLLGDVLSFLSAIAVALFSALLVASLIDLSEYRKGLLTANTAETLDVLLRPESVSYSDASSDLLQHLARNAMRVSLGIESGCVSDKLLGVCMSEAKDIVELPYAELNVDRTYSHDDDNDDVVKVVERLTYKFFSLSDEIVKKNIWRNLTADVIPCDDDKYSTLKCMLVIRGGLRGSEIEAYCNGEKEVKCVVKGGKRYFENPYPPIEIPPNCDDLEITLKRSFYLSLEERTSVFNWGYPLKSLTYIATFEDDGARFFPKVKNCSRCEGLRDCDECDKDIVDIVGLGTNSITITTHDWVGSKMSLQIEWDFDKKRV